MIFKVDAAFALELLALIAATGLLLWAKKSEGVCKGFSLVVAYFGIVAAILAMLCTTYYALRYREKGGFDHPFPTQRGMMPMEGQGTMGGPGMMGGRGMMGGQGMMGGGGENCPMMEQKMKMMQEKMEKMEQMKQEGGGHGETKSP
jgi:hypothetical protein